MPPAWLRLSYVVLLFSMTGRSVTDEQLPGELRGGVAVPVALKLSGETPSRKIQVCLTQLGLDRDLIFFSPPPG
jgi:hypothetical protein